MSYKQRRENKSASGEALPRALFQVLFLGFANCVAQAVDKVLGNGWSCDFSFQDGAEGKVLSVDGLVGVIIGFDNRALESQSGKGALGTRVSEDLSVKLPIGTGRGVPANWASGCGGFATDLEFIREQMFHALLIHHDHDEVDSFGADLQPPASAADGDESRSGPTGLSVMAGGHAASMLGAEDEAGFEQVRNHGDALGAAEHFFRDAFIVRAHHLMNHFARLVEPFDCVVAVRSCERRISQTHDQQNAKPLFHKKSPVRAPY